MSADAATTADEKLVCPTQRFAVKTTHRSRSSIACHPVKLCRYCETELICEDPDYAKVNLPLSSHWWLHPNRRFGKKLAHISCTFILALGTMMVIDV